MSAGYGWSLSDTVLLAKYAGRIYRALEEEGGSSSDYEQATNTLSSLQFTLQQIQHGLKSTDPTFRSAIKGQLAGPTSSIAQFITKLQQRYGEHLGLSAPTGKHNGAWGKLNGLSRPQRSSRTSGSHFQGSSRLSNC